MVTVDLAFETLRRRLDERLKGVDATWYTLLHPDMVPLRRYVEGTKLPFSFRLLSECREELQEYDAIVFWGDFPHAAHYLEELTPELLRFGVVKDRMKARSMLIRTLLFAGEPDDLLARTLAYGGAILHNTQSDYDDDEYNQSFSRFMAKSHRIWMRDPLSAAKVANFRRDRTMEYFGADAALLLHPGELDLPVTDWPQKTPEGKAIGVFLGTRTHIPDWLPGTCDEISSRLGCPLEWIPWFDERIPSRVAHVEAHPGHFTLGDLLASLSRYRLVITDTYHLCVNAWRVGTPVICVGAPQPAPTPQGDLTLNDVKKHVFHMAYDASDFYLSTFPDTDEVRERRIDRIAGLIEGRGAEVVAARIHNHAEWSAEKFTETLVSMLSRG
ncbi:polysaccharide pyruvyl transferase family protein [Streptomyces sp. NPDC050658]|uniref:polysaccharide pyruvyl transferase family protein n=1 Tax=unclassified Streptomyces TaxID=2593676 RepID=UPI003412A7B5